ncbi:MAG: MFS transporter [Boseongicola sp.]|nr:MFS transporter [Boseongicola sp.]
MAASIVGIVSFQLLNLRESFGFDPITEGLALSVITLFGATIGFPIAALIVRLPIRAVLVAGLSIFLLSNFVAMSASSGSSFLASRCLAGLGFIVLVIAIPNVISTLPEKLVRQVTLTMWGAYLPLGIAVGIGIAMLSGENWKLSFGIHAASCALAVIALLFVDRGSMYMGRRGMGRKTEFGNVRRLLTDPLVWLFSGGFCAFAGVFLIVIGMLPSLLQHATSLDQFSAGILTSLVCLFGVITSILLSVFPPSAARFSMITAIAFLASGTAGVFFFSYLDIAPLAIVAAIFIISITALVPSILFSSFPRVVESSDQITLLSGIVTQMGSLGSLTGPPLVTWWHHNYGHSNAWIPFGLICVAGTLLFWGAGRLMPRPHAKGRTRNFQDTKVHQNDTCRIR